MIDQDPLSDFRAEPAQLDDARRARLRARLDEVLAADRHREPSHPLAGAQTAAPEPAGVAAVIPLERIEHHSSGGRPRRTLVVAVAVAASFALLVGVVALSRSAGRTGTDATAGDPDATLTLTQLADRAAATADRALQPGELQYQRYELSQPTTSGQLLVDRYDAWHRTDGSGTTEFREWPWDPASPSPAEPGAAQSTTEDPAGTPAFGAMSYDQVRQAPTDPDALRVTVIAQTGLNDPGPAELARVVGGLLALTVTPPGVRAAALELIDQLGFRPIGRILDPAGRTGVGFALDDLGGTRQVAAFDPATGRPLSFYAVGSGGDATQGSGASDWVVYLADEVTDHIG